MEDDMFSLSRWEKEMKSPWQRWNESARDAAAQLWALARRAHHGMRAGAAGPSVASMSS
jgi:hypothetical protein